MFDLLEDLLLLTVRTGVEDLLHLEGSRLIFTHIKQTLLYFAPVEHFGFIFDGFKLRLEVFTLVGFGFLVDWPTAAHILATVHDLVRELLVRQLLFKVFFIDIQRLQIERIAFEIAFNIINLMLGRGQFKV